MDVASNVCSNKLQCFKYILHVEQTRRLPCFLFPLSTERWALWRLNDDLISFVGYPFTLQWVSSFLWRRWRLWWNHLILHLWLVKISNYAPPLVHLVFSSSVATGGVMDVNTALPEVLKTALIHDGLARGIREAAKALDKYVGLCHPILWPVKWFLSHYWNVKSLSVLLQASSPSLRPGWQLWWAHICKAGGSPLCWASNQPDKGNELAHPHQIHLWSDDIIKRLETFDAVVPGYWGHEGQVNWYGMSSTGVSLVWLLLAERLHICSYFTRMPPVNPTLLSLHFRLTTTRSWASGLVCARSTVRANPARLWAAAVSWSR